MSRQLSKKETQQQQLAQQQQNQYARDVETQEHHASANASAGLNLNLFGALSGALTSKSKKTTHTNADGSRTSVEDRCDQGAANGAASGNGTAYAQANTRESARKQKSREVGQAQGAKSVEGRKEKADHLGIEG